MAGRPLKKDQNKKKKKKVVNELIVIDVFAKEKRGRKPTFETPEEMEKAIHRYFGSITKSIETGELDNNNEPVIHTAIIEPPTFSGMCVYLGVSKDTFYEYGKKEGFDEVVKSAKLIIENYLEKKLLGGGQTAGAIFILKNNYGWAEKVDQNTTVEVGSDTIEKLLAQAQVGGPSM